jgi:hypothetical protein
MPADMLAVISLPRAAGFFTSPSRTGYQIDANAAMTA